MIFLNGKILIFQDLFFMLILAAFIIGFITPLLFCAYQNRQIRKRGRLNG